ncbi:MAG: PLP-dependent aspartate aminotransferase family protein [Bacteroidota bacterium]|nr:PLP-dependent aspartate aminotransferase family protein [Bacteroidota bacterium]
MKFGTKAVHAGQVPDPATGALMMPIYQNATFAQSRPGAVQDYSYGRVGNPTRAALESNLAALENARHAIAFASGVAAADAILRRLQPGDRVLASMDLYGGNRRLLKTMHEPVGIQVEFVDMTDLPTVDRALAQSVTMIWIETPTNPLLRVLDIEALSSLARARSTMVVVDSTFATPFLQRPLDLGADLVLHSTTKYLGGHSDVIGGVVSTDRDDWAEHLRYQITCTGAVPGPMDCFLLLRGIKTLHLRMRQHCAGARRIACWLQGHPSVSAVYYPGLPENRDHDTATRQMRDYGGMLAFEVADISALDFNLRLLRFAESLGGVESLISYPATMSHASLPGSERAILGITDGLLRLSVGVEDVEDLIEDLARLLAPLGATAGSRPA